MHSLVQKLVQNSAGTLVRQLVAGVLQLLTVIAIARALGPEGNGQFAIAILLPTTLSRFLELGMSPANAHFISSDKVSAYTALKTSLLWSAKLVPIGLAIGGLSIWLASSQWFPGVPATTLWLALAVYPAMLVQAFIASIFQGLQDFKAYNLVLLLQPAITLVLSLLAIAAGLGTTNLMIDAYLAGVLITLVVSYVTLWRTIDKRASNKSSARAYGQRVGKYALIIHIGTTLAFFNYRVDAYLLNLLGQTADVGVYVIATQMVEKLWLLSAAVSVVMLPLLSQMSSAEDQRRRITPLLYIWVSLLTALAGIVTALIAAPAVSILFGEDYRPAALILQLLLPGIVAWSGVRVLAHDIIARGQPQLNIYMNSVVLAVNVVGNLLLIPHYGANGAAIATTIAYCFCALQMLFFYTRLARSNWKRAIASSVEFSRKQLSLLRR